MKKELKRTKILIVDDEPNILLSLEYLMTKQGYQVYIARDGEEALQIINQFIPEIVILDIMMPKVDGYEVCKYIKSQAKTQLSKVIFLSAKSKSEEIAEGMQLGADLYITKPFSTRNLVKQVEELCTV